MPFALDQFSVDHLAPGTMSALMAVIGICLVASAVRFALGPTLHDRLAAIEALTLCLLAGVAGWGIITETLWFFDAVLVLAIVGFLSTVALARFAEQGDLRDY